MVLYYMARRLFSAVDEQVFDGQLSKKLAAYESNNELEKESITRFLKMMNSVQETNMGRMDFLDKS